MSVDVCTTQRKWEFSVVHMRHMLGCCGSHSAEVHVWDRTPVLHHTTDAAIAARFMLYLQSATLSVSAQDNTSAGSARWIPATKKKKKKMWNSSSTSVEERAVFIYNRCLCQMLTFPICSAPTPDEDMRCIVFLRNSFGRAYKVRRTTEQDNSETPPPLPRDMS